MAQPGDTISYTFSGGASVLEDISAVGSATVDFCDGAGGAGPDGAPGGRVKNAEIDLSGQNNLYIWVGESGSKGGASNGRYDSTTANADQLPGGASTEISFSNTDQSDSSDEPFLVAAGGGGGDFNSTTSDIFGCGGGRGGSGLTDLSAVDGVDGNGTPPPLGGDGKDSSTTTTANNGEGAIDDLNRGLVTGGTTIKGGGSGAGTNGEIQISYGPGIPPAPTNLTITQA
jgi:hypothetical protein